MIIPAARCKTTTNRFAMPTCVYCRNTAIEPFPKEHVMPRAFGRFRDRLTLSCVCGDCNGSFNRELEVLLTRDSVEALLEIRLIVPHGKRHTSSV